MMKQHILFDLDDTLVYCNKYFYLVIGQFADRMTAWFQDYGIARSSIQAKQTEIDIAGVQVLGFKSEHFPQSFIDTYRYFCDLTARKRLVSEEDLLWKLGLSVYEHVVEPYPFMEETLDRLASEGHELHLYTGGEMLIQQRKIKSMQLERYFDKRIYVRAFKNNEAMESILSEGRFVREVTWMIGNSLRTDIIPALTSGINAIHMKSDSEWVYNVVGIDIVPKGAFYILQQLCDIPAKIQYYVDNRHNEGPAASDLQSSG